ncbi:MAG: DUF928 domain-containing protein [Pseudomonadota bacterium]|nr:DUF928 domain-containing protein [Pseudomonadota bacterium]
MAPLAPQHTGLTVSKQPVFYWYLSQPWNGTIEFTLNQVGAIEPEFELELPQDTYQTGFHYLKLSDYDVSLEENIEYEWFIVIIPDPMERSGDLLASGTVRYLDMPTHLSAQLNDTPQEQRYQVYAENGIWYDAIDELNQLIKAQPENTFLHQQRAELMKQVKLQKVALYDLNT